jgi:hypothetical protein
MHILPSFYLLRIFVPQNPSPSLREIVRGTITPAVEPHHLSSSSKTVAGAITVRMAAQAIKPQFRVWNSKAFL